MSISLSWRSRIRRILLGTTCMVLIHGHNLSLDIAIHVATGPLHPTGCVHSEGPLEEWSLNEVPSARRSPDRPS